MSLKPLRDALGVLWQAIKPLEPRHRSKEAFIAYMKTKGLKGDGTPL